MLIGLVKNSSTLLTHLFLDSYPTNVKNIVFKTLYLLIIPYISTALNHLENILYKHYFNLISQLPPTHAFLYFFNQYIILSNY